MREYEHILVALADGERRSIEALAGGPQADRTRVIRATVALIDAKLATWTPRGVALTRRGLEVAKGIKR